MSRKEALTKTSANSDGVFLTQKPDRFGEVKKEIAELEQLLSGSNETSQSTLLLKKHKEVREINEALEIMKRDYKKRMDECEERRIQFEMKQNKMKDQVFKFEKFIQENDAKRIRAESKIKLEKRLYEEKCKEISLLTDKINELDLQQHELLDEVTKRSGYKAYLERILEETDEGFEEIIDILARHSTLINSNLDLVTHARELEDQVDKVRYKLHSYQTETQNKLLVSNSVFKQYQGELDKVKESISATHLEKNKQEDKQKVVTKLYSQSIDAIRNIFTRCQNTMNNPPIIIKKDGISREEEINHELELIYCRLIDLIEITNEFKDEKSNYSSSLGGDLITDGGSRSTVLTGGPSHKSSKSKTH